MVVRLSHHKLCIRTCTVENFLPTSFRWELPMRELCCIATLNEEISLGKKYSWLGNIYIYYIIILYNYIHIYIR